MIKKTKIQEDEVAPLSVRVVKMASRQQAAKRSSEFKKEMRQSVKKTRAADEQDPPKKLSTPPKA